MAIEEDKVLNAMDERAQELNHSATEFLGADYIPDVQAVVDTSKLHAEIIYLDSDKEQSGDEVLKDNMAMLADAMDDVAEEVEEGLDSLSKTILQRDEDNAVNQAVLKQALPIAFLGVPPDYVRTRKENDIASKFDRFVMGQSDFVSSQYEQAEDLTAIRDWLESSFVQTQVSSYDDEAEEIDKQEDDVYKKKQLEELSEINDNLKELNRTIDSSGGGGLLDSVTDSIGGGFGGKDKEGKGKKGKGEGGKRGGLDRRGKRPSVRERLGRFGGKLGVLGKGAVAAGLGYMYFGDFLFGEDGDPNDHGFVGALGNTMFGGDEDNSVHNQVANDFQTDVHQTQVRGESEYEQPEPLKNPDEFTKRSNFSKEELVKLKEQYVNDIKNQYASTNATVTSSFESMPVAEASAAVGAAALVGGGAYKFNKYLSEAANGISLAGTKGGLASATHVPVTNTTTVPTSGIPEAIPKAKGLSRFLPSGAGSLTMLTGAYDAYNIYNDDTLSDREKNVEYGGTIGSMAGGMAGATAGAALGTLVFPVVGSTIGGIGGGILGSMLGDEAVSSFVDWALGDETDTPKQITANQAAEDETSWYDSFANWFGDSDSDVPNLTTDAAVATQVNGLTPQEQKELAEGAEERVKLQNEKTEKNTEAMETLTKVLSTAGLSATGLSAVSGSAKNAWEWVKGIFGDSKTETTPAVSGVGAGTVLQAGVDPAAVAAQNTAAATTENANSYMKQLQVQTSNVLQNQRFKTSHEMYVNAYNEKHGYNPSSVQNNLGDSINMAPDLAKAGMQDAIKSLPTYAKSLRGYRTWLNDFRLTNVSYRDYIQYQNQLGQNAEIADINTVAPHPSKANPQDEPQTKQSTESKPNARPKPNTASRPTTQPKPTNTTQPVSKPVTEKPKAKAKPAYAPVDDDTISYSDKPVEAGQLSEDEKQIAAPTTNENHEVAPTGVEQLEQEQQLIDAYNKSSAEIEADPDYGSYADTRYTDKDLDRSKERAKYDADQNAKIAEYVKEWKAQGITYEQVMKNFDSQGFVNDGNNELKNQIAMAYGIEPEYQTPNETQLASNDSPAIEPNPSNEVTQVATNKPEDDVAIENDPTQHVEVASVDTVAPRANFVDTKELSAPVVNVTASANTDQQTGKPVGDGTVLAKKKVSARQTGAGGKTKRPTLDDIPNIINDSGLVAINLGFM